MKEIVEYIENQIEEQKEKTTNLIKSLDVLKNHLDKINKTLKNQEFEHKRSDIFHLHDEEYKERMETIKKHTEILKEIERFEGLIEVEFLNLAKLRQKLKSVL